MMLSDEEINKKVHELLGLCSPCWHINNTSHKQLDFTTSWDAFGLLWEWWQKEDRLYWKGSLAFEGFNSDDNLMPIRYISPRNLAEATVRFFKEDKNEQ